MTQHSRWLELYQNNKNKEGFDGRIYKSQQRRSECYE